MYINRNVKTLLVHKTCLHNFSIFDQRDDEKDQVCCLKDGTDGVVSTASTMTSNPLPTLHCYDISDSNDRGG